MGAMTVEQLNKQISEQVLPLIKENVGPLVKDLVAENVKKALESVAGELTVSQKANADAIKALQDKSSPSVLSTAKRERQKGEPIGAIVRALWKSKNDVPRAVQILKSEGNGDLGDLMLAQSKHITGDELGMKSMLATDPDTGGILIPQPVAAEVIDILRSRVVVRRAGADQLPMPNANFRLPKKTLGTSAYYVGEGEAGTTSKVKTGSVLLSFKKLITIVPASNDLLRYSSPGADQIIRNDITDNMAVREDQAFLRDKGTDGTPKGLRYWANSANVFDGTGGVGGTTNIDAMTTTLGNLILKLIGVDVPMLRPCWIMAPRTYINLMTTRVSATGVYAFRDEMARGNLWGWPFYYTTQVPVSLTEGANSDTSEIYLVDMADVVIGDSERLIIDASSDAAYEEGGSVKAAYSRDETVIRAIAEHDLVMRRDVSVAVAKAIRWGA
jgi:HK97 family phage major capsid protein